MVGRLLGRGRAAAMRGRGRGGQVMKGEGMGRAAGRREG